MMFHACLAKTGEIMPAIKSIEELNHVHREALAKKLTKASSDHTQIIISMGSCGIAVGAREILQILLQYIQMEHLTDISVTQIGCIGLCEWEPIVQVILGDQPKVIYGNVDERIAMKIIEQHIRNGHPVTENIIQVNSSILGS